MTKIARSPHLYFWSEGQLAYLREQVTKKSLEQIGQDLGKTRKAVLHQVHKLGLKRPRFFEELEPQLLPDGTALVPLIGKNKGQFFKISQTKLGIAKGRRWFLNNGYPGCNIAPRKIALFHRLALNAPDGVEVDHVDGDVLNATDENLRFCTSSQNKHNSRSRSGTSRFKGVDWRKEKKKWRARLRVGSATHFLGHFNSEEEAARAYDAAALELHGEFARLNFPK